MCLCIFSRERLTKYAYPSDLGGPQLALRAYMCLDLGLKLREFMGLGHLGPLKYLGNKILYVLNERKGLKGTFMLYSI